MKKEFSYSSDGESYFGHFATFEEAKKEALAEGAKFVGENVAPPAPENYFDIENWIEHVSCQDEYSMDCAEDWCRATKEQSDELNREVRAVMAAWLDRHNLRPKFWLIENAVRLREDERAHAGFTE